MVRTPSFDKNGMKKGAWSPVEDNKLRAYIHRYGHWNWRELPKYAGLSRCGKSCRLRWMNYLRPNVKRGKYTKAEDDLIMELHEKLGNKWSAIAAKLPGRTDNEIKNHWHTHLKKRIKENQSTFELKQRAIQISQSLANLELQSHESPRSEINEVTDELGSKDVTDEIYQQILESSPLSSQELSSSDFSSSMTSDYALLSDKNWVGEDSMSSLELFEESVRNFWIEPVFEGFSYQQNEFSSNLAEGESMCPCFLDHGDDSIEWFHQILKELPEN
ncbi:hypothetical protein CsSME_00027160 [Camellia sinensis var. sinensis]